MRERFSRPMQLVTAVAVLALAACGGGGSSPRAKPWVGQWTQLGTGAGTLVLDLRSDGEYSRIYYGGGIGVSVVAWAEKGRYTFITTTDYGNGDIAGTLQVSPTHSYDTAADVWGPVMSGPDSAYCIVHVSPKMIDSLEWDTFWYYGPEAEIPTTL